MIKSRLQVYCKQLSIRLKHTLIRLKCVLVRFSPLFRGAIRRAYCLCLGAKSFEQKQLSV